MGKKHRMSRHAPVGNPKQDHKREERAKKKDFKKQKARLRFGPQEERAYEEQMRMLGCHIHEMTADGNCLFRALADQMEGRPQQHSQYRHQVIDYIEVHREDFEPFMEDDEKFDAYVKRMREEKEWGGQQELCAASRLFKVNIVVHQLQAPRLEVHADGPTRTLHLSYHGEYHYNSVRRLDDDCQVGKAPKPLSIGVSTASVNGAGVVDGDAHDIARMGAPWTSEENISRAWKPSDGDAAAALEALVTEGDNCGSGAAENKVDAVGAGASDEGSGGDEGVNDADTGGGDEGDNDADTGGDHRPPSPTAGAGKEKQGSVGADTVKAKGSGGSASCGGKGAGRAKGVVRIGREGAERLGAGQCPCGSGKKYRKCCRKLDKHRDAIGSKSANASDKDAADAARLGAGQCPCGSGKKYRKCCRKLDKHRDAIGSKSANASDKDAADAASNSTSAAQLEDRLKAIVL